jgi:predicted CXXCH cytochrome family protein
MNTKSLFILFAILTILIHGIHAQTNEDCMMCHEDQGLTGMMNGKEVSMYINMKLLKNSAHNSLSCISCHKDLTGSEFPHLDNLKSVKCGTCHIGYDDQIKNDIHKKLNVNLGNKKPDCKTCHGTHEIKKVAGVKNKSKEYCGRCHSRDILNGLYHSKGETDTNCKLCHKDKDYDSELKKSIHKNLACSNCHGYVFKNLETHDKKDASIPTADCYLCHNKIADEHRESIHGISLEQGINESAHCWDCHGSHNIYKVKSDSSQVYFMNLVKTCGKCHDDPTFSERHFSTVKQPGKMYMNSVHGKLVQEGRSDAPNCVTCHGVHNIKNRVMPGSTISTINVSKLCGTCHKEISEEYEQSIHYLAVKKGVTESPTCNDCHSEHAIDIVNTKKKREEIKKIQDETCLECHENLLLNSRFGIKDENAIKYQDSYHGLAVMRGDKDAAMCIDCHGVHKILPKYNKESTINDGNVVATCAKCHKGATDTFSKSYSHISKDDDSAKYIETIVGDIYFWLIVIVIGAMFVHNLLIFVHDLKERRRDDKTKIKITRFTKNELIQHTVLLLSFIVLAITGFQLKYPESFWSRWLTDLGMIEPVRQWTHRISAIIMIALSLWHVVYLIITARGRDVLKSLFPRYSDIKLAIQNIKYYLHLTKEHPEFDNYNYMEKAEYWALIWGTLVMGLTGFILWFPTIVGDWAPLWVIKVSEIVHFYEAILATLAIVVWHWFFVMFRPREYPLNFTSVDGKMTIIHYKDEHRLRFKKVMAEWMEYKTGRKTKKELTHFATIFINAVEKSGTNTDEFIQSEIEKDQDLKAYLKERQLV